MSKLQWYFFDVEVVVDKGVLFKIFMKVLVQCNGLMVIFMVKWLGKYLGQSGYIYVLLCDCVSDKLVFFDFDQVYNMSKLQWYVLVDDYGCYWFLIFISFIVPVDKKIMCEQCLKIYFVFDYKLIFNCENNWGFDVDQQKKVIYMGMGFDINIYDQFVCELFGCIVDCMKENFGMIDKGIVLYRCLLVDAIQKMQKGDRMLMMFDLGQLYRDWETN